MVICQNCRIGAIGGLPDGEIHDHQVVWTRFWTEAEEACLDADVPPCRAEAYWKALAERYDCQFDIDEIWNDHGDEWIEQGQIPKYSEIEAEYELKALTLQNEGSAWTPGRRGRGRGRRG